MDGIYISSSPHFSLSNTTQKIMLCVIISLLPECAAGIYFFGVKSLFLILSSVISCVFFEAVFQKLTGQKIIVSNLSAVVTGLLLALVCPPTLPLWTVIIGGAVAVIVAKGIFGGLGSNVFNPALTGRAFLVISFPSLMGASWLLPNFTRGTDAVSSAAQYGESFRAAKHRSQKTV